MATSTSHKNLPKKSSSKSSRHSKSISDDEDEDTDYDQESSRQIEVDEKSKLMEKFIAEYKEVSKKWKKCFKEEDDKIAFILDRYQNEPKITLWKDILARWPCAANGKKPKHYDPHLQRRLLDKIDDFQAANIRILNEFQDGESMRSIDDGPVLYSMIDRDELTIQQINYLLINLVWQCVPSVPLIKAIPLGHGNHISNEDHPFHQEEYKLEVKNQFEIEIRSYNANQEYVLSLTGSEHDDGEEKKRKSKKITFINAAACTLEHLLDDKSEFYNKPEYQKIENALNATLGEMKILGDMKLSRPMIVEKPKNEVTKTDVEIAKMNEEEYAQYHKDVDEAYKKHKEEIQLLRAKMLKATAIPPTDLQQSQEY
jgi:hypothetical protein